jgi:hypothetical protein
MRRHLLAALLLPVLPGCSAWFFSGEPKVDRSHPVALVETTGGIELGATTEFGVLTLGRSAATGPCRVHYFLGPTPMIEDGELKATGSLFTRAEIDLKTMRCARSDAVRSERRTARDAGPRTAFRRDRVRRSSRSVPGVDGDVLADPGSSCPPAPRACTKRRRTSWQFAVLIAASRGSGTGSTQLLVYAASTACASCCGAVPHVSGDLRRSTARRHPGLTPAGTGSRTAPGSIRFRR